MERKEEKKGGVKEGKGRGNTMIRVCVLVCPLRLMQMSK